MYQGVWCPKNENLSPKILILGESHYGDVGTQGQKSTGLTKDVVESFLSGKVKDQWKEFFYKIAISFGYKRDINEIADFYNRVYFGNYVDVLCDVGTANEAKKYIWDNRIDYNNELFEFCNKNEIDIIICFSKEVHNALPKLELYGEKNWEKEIGIIGEDKRRNLAMKTRYKKGNRVECKIALKKDLLVYGIRHPSSLGGYKADQVYDFLSSELKGCSICK